MKNIIYVVFLMSFFWQVSAQENAAYTNSDINVLKTFTLKGVIKTEDESPLKNISIRVNGGNYAVSNALGEFRVQVKKGDEVVIANPEFETIYYTVQDDDKLTVIVEASNEEAVSFEEKEQSPEAFQSQIDSAKFYQNSSLDKSISFITKSIEKSKSTKQNAEAFETLADIYVVWKQYDLAATNYKISLNSKASNATKIKLAKAYFLNKDYAKSLDVYQEISNEELQLWELIDYKEGVADVKLETSELKAALNGYKSALKVAEDNNITPKLTDLNSKIGSVYAKMGVPDVAETYYNKSLGLAAKENKKRKVEENVIVADFENESQDYDSEIKLRKEIITTVENDKILETIANQSAITLQKQNYKIGNAYYLQQDYEKAVPFLEKSIKQASEKEDLVVKKDATKKLSEVFSASKNYNKALETYKAYTGLVEELYRKKEQEISQAARFSKRITEKQNRILSLETERQLVRTRINLTEEKNKRQQFYIYALIGGLFLVLLLAYLMYKFIKQQRLANNLLALKSLRSQMNPHFIFNALNSVNSFIAVNDERTANKYLSDFSKLMRAVLENSEEDFIPLEKELDLIQLYTKLEHFRFQDKFDYVINVQDSIVVSDYKIPPMLLQPYIENAVWHGLRYKETKGLLQINIEETQQNHIKIAIIDNGIGREKSIDLKTNHQKKHNSKGLGNIAKRVEILNDMYKDKISVQISDNPTETGTCVNVIVKK